MVLFLPFSLYQAASFDFSAVSARAWWAVAYFGAVFTVVAYLFWFSGVSRVSGATAGIFSAVMPVSAVILATIFLDEAFTLFHGIGIALVLSAILMMALVPEQAEKNRVVSLCAESSRPAVGPGPDEPLV